MTIGIVVITLCWGFTRISGCKREPGGTTASSASDRCGFVCFEFSPEYSEFFTRKHTLNLLLTYGVTWPASVERVLYIENMLWLLLEYIGGRKGSIGLCVFSLVKTVSLFGFVVHSVVVTLFVQAYGSFVLLLRSWNKVLPWWCRPRWQVRGTFQKQQVWWKRTKPHCDVYSIINWLSDKLPLFGFKASFHEARAFSYASKRHRVPVLSKSCRACSMLEDYTQVVSSLSPYSRHAFYTWIYLFFSHA